MKTHIPFQMTDINDTKQNFGPMNNRAQTDPKDRFSVKRAAAKWLGFIVTILLAAAAFAPGMMHVPAAWRPWEFVLFIFWFVIYASGMFTQ